MSNKAELLQKIKALAERGVDGENENATIFKNEEDKEFFVYCKVCSIETIDTYTSKAKAVKAFSEGKTKSIIGSEAAKHE